MLLAALAAAVLGLVQAADAAWPEVTRTALPRSTTDRPDDRSGPQIHVVYVVPSDGEDRALDTNGTIAASVRNFESWFAAQTGGRRLSVDTFGGDDDISFHRMSQTDAQIAANGPFVRDVVERELHASGFNAAGKVYAVYYDGTSTAACGGGAWPPVLPGNVAALYLRATFGAGFLCYTPSGSLAGLQIMDLAILHEVLHTLGFVPACAPHHTRAGHVSDSPNDLMYAGDDPWRPSVLDVGRDDYYDAHRPGCPDLADSPYLVSGAADTASLTVTIEAGSAGGSVSSAPAGIACPGTCNASFARGSPVTLTAVPAPGARFLGWAGACSGMGSCNVVVDAAKTVSAAFGVLEYRLTVRVKGRGRVTSAPSGLSCAPRCSALFTAGTRVALRAVPAAGWHLVRWSGACSGRVSCSVPMSRARAAVATFAR